MFENSTRVSRTLPIPERGKVGRRGEQMKGKLRQPHHRAAAAPYPDRTVVDHQLDIPKRAGLILSEHGARDRAARVQQQAAFVPRDQRASPQVSADEPRRPIVLVKGVALVPQRHDVNGPARQRAGRGEQRRVVSASSTLIRTGSAGAARGAGGREPRAPGRPPRDGAETMAGPRRVRT